MSTFNFGVKVNSPFADITDAALGAAAGEGWITGDVGKAVKMGTAQNYVLAVGGNELEGFVTSVEPNTVNAGFSFGGVQRDGRVEVEVGAAQVGNVTVGNYAVGDTQAAVGTAGAAKVKEGSPTIFRWRIVRIVTGTGASGDTIIIERV